MKAVYLESEQFRSDSLIPATECNKSSDFMRETKKNLSTVTSCIKETRAFCSKETLEDNVCFEKKM